MTAKLMSLGFANDALKWVTSYLSGRKQKVYIGDSPRIF